MSVNVKSALISGLISGLIINLSAIGMLPIVGDEMDKVLASRGLPALNNLAMIYFSIISFIFGISLVFLYVVVKDKLGEGIKTAIIVSLIFWFLIYLMNVGYLT